LPSRAWILVCRSSRSASLASSRAASSSSSAARNLAADRRWAAAARRSAAASPREPRRRESGRGLLARAQRLLPSPLQFEHRRKASAGRAEARQVAVRFVGGLPPGRRRLRKVARKLRAGSQELQGIQPVRTTSSLRPELECPAGCDRAVAVCVHITERSSGPDERLPGSVRLTSLDPVLGDDHCRRGIPLQELSHLRVQLGSPGPCEFAVARITDERMPESQPLRSRFDDQAQPGQLVGPSREASRGGDERRGELLAGNRCRHGRRPRLGRRRGHAKEDRVPDAVRDRQVVALREPESVRALGQASARDERRPQLLNEERKPVGSIENRRRQLGRSRRTQAGGEELCGGVAIEGLDHYLTQPFRPAKLGSHPAERVGPRDVVASIGDDHRNRFPVEGPRQPGQEIKRRMVGPLQVIQHDRERARRRLDERRADRFEERFAVAGRGRGTQLGQQRCQMAAQWRADSQRAPTAQLPEHRHDRAVGRRAVLVRVALERLVAMFRQDGSYEHRLADSRLAGHEQEARAPRPGLAEEPGDLSPLTRSIEKVAVHHDESLPRWTRDPARP
jgi:hypothetical protein